jgi:hypothetical protein
MKQLTQREFKERCTAEMWEKYVEGLITEAADRDSYHEAPNGRLCIDVDGGYQSNITLMWHGTDREWQEEYPDEGE